MNLRFLDVVSNRAGKLESMDYVRRTQGFAWTNTVACGDSGNDILMLSGETVLLWKLISCVLDFFSAVILGIPAMQLRTKRWLDFFATLRQSCCACCPSPTVCCIHSQAYEQIVLWKLQEWCRQTYG